MKFVASLFIFLLIPALAFGEDVWLGKDRKKWTNTESRKVKNDFGGSLVVTPDLNWREKWNTDPAKVVYFNQTASISRNEELSILTFFVNPKTNKQNSAKVLCSINVARPDGSAAVDLRDFVCLDGPLKGNPEYVRLAPTVIQFVGEQTDPLGTWRVRVKLVDVIRETELNLETSIELNK